VVPQGGDLRGERAAVHARGDVRRVSAAPSALKKLGVDILWIMPVQPIGKKNRKGTGPQTALTTDGGGRVYAFTRTRDTNTVLVAVNFGDSAATVKYEGMRHPGEYIDWFGKSKVAMTAAGSLDIPAHGYRVLVQ
jgi:glycosidase